MMTLIDWIDRMAQALEAAGVSYGHGTTNAFDEAAWLVLSKLGLPLDALDANAERELTQAEQNATQALVDERIATRKPAAYLTGEAWLQGVPFTVDERVIVPRSLVAEVLADGSIDAFLPADTRRVLDLCTGNGSLAVLAAMAWPGVDVVASDVSAGALAVAAVNVRRHGLEDRISLAQGDGLAAVDGVFDLILCNPPYVAAESMATLPPEYRAEPALALAGGADGMDFVRRLLRDAPGHLAPAGVLVLEIGHGRAAFEAAFPRLEAVWLDTSAGEDQVLLLSRDALARMTPGAARVPTLARRRGAPAPSQDWVAEEVPVALQFNGISHAVMLATPADLEDFALGFSLTEHIIDSADDLRDVETAAACLDDGQGIVVDITISSRCIARLKEQRRNLVGRTGCGICGTDNLANAVRGVADRVRPPAVDPAVLKAAYTRMGQQQTLQRATGATHAAAWCEADGTLRLLREDVGRHNALDKLIGALAKSGLDAASGFVIVTSRASYEMVHKTATAGVGLLAAISAPTALAIRQADAAGLCLLGFVRGDDWVAYSHADALAGIGNGAPGEPRGA